MAISSIQINQHVLDKYDRLPIGYVKKDTKVSIVQEDKLVPKGEKQVRSLLQGQAYQKVT